MKIPVIHPINLTKVFVDIPEGYCLRVDGEMKKGDLYYSFSRNNFYSVDFPGDSAAFIVISPDPKN